MIGKKINQLATELAPVSTDLTIIGDPISGVSKKITLAQLGAIFSGAVSFYTNLAGFPALGDINVIYCAKDTQKLYLWSGSAYTEVFPSQALLDTYQLRSEKGVSNGYASLDSSGKVPISQLPSSIMEYKGTWNAATNTPTLANGTGDTGDVYICNVAGTVNFGAGPITFAVGDYVIYSGSIWQRSSGAVGTVTSVAVSRSGDALAITGSPITTSGTINIGFAGTGAQYIKGDGTLATFPSIISQAQNLVTEVYNNTGATLTKGTIVYINGGQGNLPTVTKALATGDSTSAQTYGVVQTDITNMNNGYVVVEGRLGDLDTQAYANGTQLYLSPTTAGTWTSTKPYAPNHLVYVGIVVRAHPTQGVVEVKIMNGFEIDELHNVAAQNPDNNDILQYKTSTSLWTKVAGTTSNIAEGSNLYYTDARSRAALSFTAGSGAYNSTTGVITIPTNTNQLTNGAAYITLASLSASSPLSYNNTTGAFSISQANSTTNGFLSSTDWNTFNSKQAGLNGTGFVKISGTTISYDNSTYYLASNPNSYIALTNLSAGAGISYNNTTGVIASTITQYTDAMARASISGGTGISYNSTTGVITNTITQYTDAMARASISLTTTGTSGAATYNSTTGVLNIPNYAPDLSGYVPTSRTLTINGTAFDLSANRSWSVGTVTSVGLSSATSGVTIGSTPITTSGTITLAIATASGSQQGLLSSTDWTTFNNKQNALTNPVTGTGTTNYLPKFTGTSTIGDSALSDGGAIIIASNRSIQTTGTGNYFRAGNYLWAGGSGGDYGSVGYNIGYTTTTNTYNYVFTDNASMIRFQVGGFQFLTAPSGTAGNAISFTQAMTLNASGNLSIGNTNNTYKLDVSGTGRFMEDLNLDTSAANTQRGLIFRNAGSVSWQVYKSTANDFRIYRQGSSNDALVIGTNDAATFSSSVTATGLILDNGNNLTWGGVYGAGIPTIVGYNAGSGGAIYFYPSGSSSGEKMRLFASGNLSIGNTNDTYKLDVTGIIRASSAGIFGEDVTAGGAILIKNTINAYAYQNFGANSGYGWQIGKGDNSGGIVPSNGFYIYDLTNSATRFTIASTGAATFSNSVTAGGSVTANGNISSNISKSGSGVENVNFLQLRLFGTNAIGDSLDIRYLNNAGNNIANISAILGGDNVAYGSLAFSTRNYFTDSMVEVMRINNRGNVGISTTSPFNKLTVAGVPDSGYGLITIATNWASNINTGIKIGAAGDNGGAGVDIRAHTNYSATGDTQMSFWTNGTSFAERMRITSGGLVGIGTTNPQARLQVTTSSFPILKIADTIGGGGVALGDAEIPDNYMGIWRGQANSISGGGFLNIQGNGIAFMSSNNVFGSGTERMRITSGGLVGIGTSNPLAKFVVSDGGLTGMEFGVSDANNRADIVVYDRGESSYKTFRVLANDLVFKANQASVDALSIASTGAATFTGDVKVKTLEVTNATTYGSSAGISTYMQITVNGNNYVIPLHGTP